MVDVIDLYMENFDEGKNDVLLPSILPCKKSKTHRDKESAPARRKMGYYKSTKRMAQLRDVDHFVPEAKRLTVLRGMLRKHQLPMKNYSSKFSISNKRRMDSVQYKLNDAYV